MYKKILIPIDNSLESKFATLMGTTLAGKSDSLLVGLHVYAAGLHATSFRKLEAGLPPKYQGEGLLYQRMVHDSLISKGLQLISESYLQAFAKTCDARRVPYETKMREGKNFMEIITEVEGGDYDLVIIGFHGLGRTGISIIGSVCERVVRPVRKDVLIVKNSESLEGGKVLVTIDGSPNSYKALRKALALVKTFDMQTEIVTVFDPYFHKIAFRSLADTLASHTEEIFKIKEQERLHDEITDKGLRFVAQGYLNNAEMMADQEGIGMKASILEGKPFQEILRYIEKNKPTLLVTGRYGTHRCPLTDLGSQAENLLRFSPINHLIVSDGIPLENDKIEEMSETYIGGQDNTALKWTEGARKRLESIPKFIRNMTRYRLELFAEKRGYGEISEEVMSEMYRNWGEDAGWNK